MLFSGSFFLKLGLLFPRRYKKGCAKRGVKMKMMLKLCVPVLFYVVDCSDSKFKCVASCFDMNMRPPLGPPTSSFGIVDKTRSKATIR